MRAKDQNKPIREIKKENESTFLKRTNVPASSATPKNQTTKHSEEQQVHNI